MSYIMVDVESDGPIPGEKDFSMICLGAILVQKDLPNAPTFYGRLRPISERWVPEALRISGFSREQTLAFDEPRTVMETFEAWLRMHGGERPMLVSDNNGFDA